MIKIITSGIMTGMMLQFAIGPVFFLIFNFSIKRTFIDGIIAAIAVTLVDYLYISLAIIGVGRILQKTKLKFILGILSSLVLLIFGLIIILSAANSLSFNIAGSPDGANYANSFISAFLLTISSPLTILFWTGLFTAKSIEKNYSKNQLIIFGFAAGLATLLFLSICVIVFSSFKYIIPVYIISLSNVLVGSVLILYAFFNFIKLRKGIQTQKH